VVRVQVVYSMPYLDVELEVEKTNKLLAPHCATKENGTSYKMKVSAGDCEM